MASLIFSHAKACVNKAKKDAMKFANAMEECGKDYKEEYQKIYQSALDSEMKKFEEYLEFSSRLHERYLEVCGSAKGDREYFITIRPDTTMCEFIDFRMKVEKFLERKCFISYTYSFEQKGECLEDLGKGFHVHIVAKMKQASKGNVLRDTLSSWNDWITTGKIAANCIHVLPTKNGEKLINDYLIEYKSDDEHKEPTKQWDEIWRSNNSLQNLYKSP